ncbi:MAG TPA: hypothetical protein VFB60_25305 [Ktedonobacteraceae bacterium]|nr:hypothetical protein [Ktedonobacteraceae bacterium]
MLFLIIVALFLFLLCLLYVSWINSQIKQKPGYKLGVNKGSDLSKEPDLSKLQGNRTEFRAAFEMRYKNLDVSALRRVAGLIETEHPPTINIDRKFRITLPASIYINQPFELKVFIAGENKEPPQTTGKEVSPQGDTLRFPACEEKPPIQVEIQSAQEECSATTTKQMKVLEKGEPTVFSFLIKPLKAEACILAVVISYAPRKVDLAELDDTSEQLEKTTTDTTSSPNNGTPTTEHVEQVTRKSAISEPIVVKTEQVQVDVKSFFGWNTTELSVAKGIIGALAAIILVVIALITNKTDGMNTVVLIVGCVLNAFGISPISDSITKLFDHSGQQKQGQ